MTRTEVAILYPSDPLGDIPGGIETFIRGILGHAPPDIGFSVIGLTTDRVARPPHQWTEHRIRDRTFRHYPVYVVDDPKRQPKIPATLRYMAALAPRARRLTRGFDVFEFHRLEPAFLFRRGRTPSTAVFHQNMDVIRGEGSDIRWKHVPGLYFALERAGLSRLDAVYVVQEAAVKAYQARYPALADRFRFTPTWMDPDIFGPLSPEARRAAREALLAPYGVGPASTVITTVGRLDNQKDPVLLVEAFARFAAVAADPHLVLIGDGVLRDEVRAAAARLDVADRVHLTGLMPPMEVARVLNAADVFALSSQYEGMPMAVLEALGCGIPVVTTDVGEVRRAVTAANGVVVDERTADTLAAALADVVTRHEALAGAPCIDAAMAFTPDRVLAPLYENYRRLAGR